MRKGEKVLISSDVYFRDSRSERNFRHALVRKDVYFFTSRRRYVRTRFTVFAVMRLAISLMPQADSLSLPLSYNHLLQAFIYGQLEPNLASWFQAEAYRYAQRRYKMLTFSRLEGTFKLEPKTKTISFYGPVSFKLASCNKPMLFALTEYLLNSSTLFLGGHALAVQGIEMLKAPTYRQALKLKTLSPITVYAMLERADGSKHIHYYAPYERAWGYLIMANLAYKAKALGWQDDASTSLQAAYVKPLSVTAKDKKVIKYKHFFLEAYTGSFEASLPQAYFELAYNVGLGGKNAQGFGMLEVV